MRRKTNNPVIRRITTESLGKIDVLFYFYPAEEETRFEPSVPEEIEIVSIMINDCECLSDIDEQEYLEVRETLWKLLDNPDEFL